MADFSWWLLHTEMVYLLADGYMSQYQPQNNDVDRHQCITTVQNCDSEKRNI